MLRAVIRGRRGAGARGKGGELLTNSYSSTLSTLCSAAHCELHSHCEVCMKCSVGSVQCKTMQCLQCAVQYNAVCSIWTAAAAILAGNVRAVRKLRLK